MIMTFSRKFWIAPTEAAWRKAANKNLAHLKRMVRLRDVTPLVEPLAIAVVNGGRWIARCPGIGCWGGEYVDPHIPLFFCCSCCNSQFGMRVLKVSFPGNWQEIERVLLRRPYAKNRHWAPGTTVAELEAENRTHGVKEN